MLDSSAGCGSEIEAEMVRAGGDPPSGVEIQEISPQSAPMYDCTFHVLRPSAVYVYAAYGILCLCGQPALF